MVGVDATVGQDDVVDSLGYRLLGLLAEVGECLLKSCLTL
jgi:hypothetical protein